MAASCRGLDPPPVKSGSPSLPVPGYRIARPRRRGRRGPARRSRARSPCACPCRPGTLPTLWNDDERCVASYLARYPGWYLTGDGGHIDEDGYLFVMGRIDDVINVAGHRLSTGRDGGGRRRRTRTSPSARCSASPTNCAARCRSAWSCSRPAPSATRASCATSSWRSCASASARSPASATRASSPRLPKTRSGKILRSTMRDIAAGRDYALPATIDDPAIIDEIAACSSRARLTARLGSGRGG